MCLRTKDKKKKTGIRYGWKIFKEQTYILSDSDEIRLTGAYQYDFPFSVGKRIEEPNPKSTITKFATRNYPGFDYPRGFHFFINKRAAVKLLRTRYRHRMEYVLYKCRTEKVHTTGKQYYGTLPSGRDHLLHVGVCHKITLLKEVLWRKIKCQK